MVKPWISVCPKLSFPYAFSGNPLPASNEFQLKNYRNDNITRPR